MKRIAHFSLVMVLAIAATSPAFAHRLSPWDRAPAHARTKPSVSYAGDCGPNPPAGYRHDLKNWRTGFSDRDFSCYILNQN